MKANKKFVDEEEAVSAVIGVILMVAITVAIAATVYVYVSGILGTSPDVTPSIQFQKDNADKTLTVAQADPLNLDWDNINITVDIRYSQIDAKWTATGYTGSSAPAAWGQVNAGHRLEFAAACNVTFTWTPTNTLLGSWEFTD